MQKLTAILSLVVIVAGSLISACSDDPATPPGRDFTIVSSQDYSFADIELSNYPAGSTLNLRPDYWSSTELTGDPSARVTALGNDVFRLSFASLSQPLFVTAEARILLSVDSVVDELNGVVVLCDSTGPIILSPECQGDCQPLCGIDDDHGCAGRGPIEPR